MEDQIPDWIYVFAVIGVGTVVAIILTVISGVISHYRYRGFMRQLDDLNVLCDEALEYLPEYRKVYQQIVDLRAEPGYDPEHPTELEKKLYARFEELKNLISDKVGQMKIVIK